MTDDLKRIEEKHNGYHWCAEVSGIEWKARGEPPCDVVRLARALDALMKAVTPALQKSYPKMAWDAEWREAERVLREVAGEEVRR